MFLTLIGYRATGKTTLARLAAERLGWECCDSDAEIERRAGKSIAEIFAEDGETAFRELEVSAIAELCRRDQTLLAAGGGAPLRVENRRAMREAGKIVCLTAGAETILARMATDAATRPPLTDRPPLDEILQLLAIREPIYRELADATIDTDGKTPEESVEELLATKLFL